MHTMARPSGSTIRLCTTFSIPVTRRHGAHTAHERMMHTTLYSHSGQGIRAGLSRWGTTCLPACLLVSINFRQNNFRQRFHMTLRVLERRVHY